MNFEQQADGLYYRVETSNSPRSFFWSPSYGGAWFTDSSEGPFIFVLSSASESEVEILLECLSEHHGGVLICGNLAFAGPALEDDDETYLPKNW